MIPNIVSSFRLRYPLGTKRLRHEGRQTAAKVANPFIFVLRLMGKGQFRARCGAFSGYVNIKSCPTDAEATEKMEAGLNKQAALGRTLAGKQLVKSLNVFQSARGSSPGF